MFLKNYYVNSTTRTDIHLITHDVKRAVRESEVEQGMLLVLVPGGTAGVALLEEDPKIHEEFRDWIEQQVPETEGARPARRSGSGKNFAHLRAALVGSQLTLPVQDAQLKIGSWQEVVLLDFDDKLGRREITIQVMGESNAGEANGR